MNSCPHSIPVVQLGSVSKSRCLQCPLLMDKWEIFSTPPNVIVEATFTMCVHKITRNSVVKP